MVFLSRSVGSQGWGKLLELEFQYLKGTTVPHGSDGPRFLTPPEGLAGSEPIESTSDV